MEEEDSSTEIRKMQRMVNHQSSWKFLRSGDVKRETESLLVAGQDQALNTNLLNKDIYHTTVKNKYHLCNERVENLDHIAVSCKILAQKRIPATA